MTILGIDPGKGGAFCLLAGDHASFMVMPMAIDDVDFEAVRGILTRDFLPYRIDHIYLERALPMAMGSKHAFNYGRGFAALEIAIKLSEIPVTYIEPSKWMKLVLEGIDANLKTKSRCAIAVERLFPKHQIIRNRNGKMHDGMVDALLIAEYGRRQKLK